MHVPQSKVGKEFWEEIKSHCRLELRRAAIIDGAEGAFGQVECSVRIRVGQICTGHKYSERTHSQTKSRYFLYMHT